MVARGGWMLEPGGQNFIQLLDKSGHARAAVGNTELKVTKTGEKRQLAKSTLVLFDKDGKTIFKAP